MHTTAILPPASTVIAFLPGGTVGRLPVGGKVPIAGERITYVTPEAIAEVRHDPPRDPNAKLEVLQLEWAYLSEDLPALKFSVWIPALRVVGTKPEMFPKNILSFKTRDAEIYSNLHPAIVWVDGDQYPSVEHGYQASKTALLDQRRLILREDAAGAKRIGKFVRLRPDWGQGNPPVKVLVMRELLQQKFAPGSHFAKALLGTWPGELAEGNWGHDTFWGVTSNGGANWLGRLLMDHREDLRRGKGQAS
jgi:ribA/ribD-fused uncharacterized protein